jgi:hypothetical protein
VLVVASAWKGKDIEKVVAWRRMRSAESVGWRAGVNNVAQARLTTRGEGYRRAAALSRRAVASLGWISNSMNE